MTWTSNQLKGIQFDGGNILLSAAAGSGKTAVLTERVVRKINEGSLSIEDMLILTFTKKAAAEMKEKIIRALTKNTKDTKHHARNNSLISDVVESISNYQSPLFSHASISTIHAFCLDVITANVHLLSDMPANFSVCSDIEEALIKNQTLDYIINEYYERSEQDEDICDFFDCYSGNKSDDTLKESLMKLYSFAFNMPDPHKWLDMCTAPNIELYTDELKRIITYLIKEILSIYDDALGLTNYISPSCKHREHLTYEKDNFLLMYEDIKCATNYAEIYRACDVNVFVKSFAQARSKDEIEKSYQQSIKQHRDTIKEIFCSICYRGKDKDTYRRQLLCQPAEQLEEHRKLTEPLLRVMVSIVKSFDEKFTAEKRERNIVTQNDIEHIFIRLLEGDNGVAADLKEQYKEIYIDEYQDINPLQEHIFRQISDNNMFMVGDIKQSIYRFRGATPEIFADKFNEYKNGAPAVSVDDTCDLSKNTTSGTLIRLSNNFRSGFGVIDFVNKLFASVMSKNIGGIDYTEEEHLIADPNYPEVFDGKTEVYIIDSDDFDEQKNISKIEIEARFVTRRITEIMKNTTVWDSNIKLHRTIEYSDIAILMRSLNSNNGREIKAVIKEFNNAGIPVRSDATTDYLTSPEVSLILSFLQIIDNPLQDIPLIAVARSDIFRFTTEELAQIRIANRNKNSPFYALMLEATDDLPCYKRILRFINNLIELRKLSREFGPDHLIWYIYTQYNYLDNKTERQRANLRLLFEQAGDYSKMISLFDFNRYISSIIAEGKDLSATNIEDENVVHIMSMHQSKGLEFPIVIILNAGKEFNTIDIKNDILWHERLGLSTYYIDSGIRGRFPSVCRSIAAEVKRRELLSEEMRLLYVALTRAKEKLIIIGSLNNKTRWKKTLFTNDGKMRDYFAATAYSYLHWILPVMPYETPDISDLLNIEDAAAKIVSDAKNSDTYIETEDTEDVFLQYKSTIRIPTKLSVSQLKRREMPEDDVEVPYFQYVPSNLKYVKETISGTEKGTIFHFVMRHIDEKRVDSPDSIREMLNDMVSEEVINQQQADIIDINKVYKFYVSELGKRLKAADYVRKEYKFYMKLPAKELGFDSNEDVLVQGVIDCFFKENGKIIIIDYKTDNTPDLSLEKHRFQMKYYIRGLKQIYEMDTSAYLYFFKNGRIEEV